MEKFLLAVVLLVSRSDMFVVSEECPMGNKMCEFRLKILPKLTMMKGGMRVMPNNNGLYNYNDATKTLLAADEQADVITTDGVYSRLVIAINGQLPGPDLIVYEGQQVIVYVTNEMHTDSVTLHFHGIHQRNTPWMDGVAFVTQCPIHPGLTFKYNFTASPKGTHWYHAHIGDQRSMGLYGNFIVRRRSEPYPLENEHIFNIQDWNHDMDPETAYQKMLFGIYDCDERALSCKAFKETMSVDGARFSRFEFHSGLINGKGRYHSSATENNGAPLSTFTVERNKMYRFRVIGAATLYPFRVYVAQHPIKIIASDGQELQPIEVESFIIQSGERFDFTLTATQPTGNYMIIAQTLEKGQNHIAEAILHYRDAAVNASITITPIACSASAPCKVFNCPFLFYPESQNRKCVTFNDAKSNEPTFSVQDVSGTPDNEVFLNFAFPGFPGNTPGSVNGRQFVSPTVSALTQPQEVGPGCSAEDCGSQKICSCPYVIDVEKDTLVQMVFTNMLNGSGWSHPVHLHGHYFSVLKIGFPAYNSSTGQLIDRYAEHKDIDCRGSFCNNATWKNGQPSDLNFDKPLLKDTLVIPTGGYVVVRFKADNPGLWFIHCHIDLHNTNGMAMAMNESFTSQPEAPKALPRCRNYVDDVDYDSALYTSGSNLKALAHWLLFVLMITWRL